MTKGRLEAFSDGVIAIIITITILIIDLPEGKNMVGAFEVFLAYFVFDAFQHVVFCISQCLENMVWKLCL